MRIFKENLSRKKIRLLTDIPSEIRFKEGSPAELIFKNNLKCSATCLKCKNPLCIMMPIDKIDCKELTNFPYDKNCNVCPVDAIKWNTNQELPVIDKEKCIKCGLCVKSCPVGAIYYDNEIIVNSSYSNNFVESNAIQENLSKHSAQISDLLDVKRTGTFINESDQLLSEIYSKLSRCSSNLHNFIGRNILIGLDCICSTRRIGDVYTRMDAVYSTPSHTLGAIEIEFGHDTLDASRGILDDIAVLYTRYDVNKENNLALVICLQLPNARQGYWQVIKDIKKVEKICINTITIGALLILLWNNKSFDPSKTPFYVDYDNMEIRTLLEKILNRPINLTDKLLGITEPQK